MEQRLLTGFNRRFSKPLRDIKALFADVHEPLQMMYRVNAGSLPANHWLKNDGQGGRVVGEVCHFVDCLSFLTGEVPRTISSRSTDRARQATSESVSVSLMFGGGSLGSIEYFSGGSTSLGKERLEVHGGGRSAVMEDFERVTLFNGSRRIRKSYDGSKGHREEVAHFLEMVGSSIREEITFESMYATTLATLLIHESIRKGKPVDL
jgi:polar amino acid transport system substrate-binding protein